MTIRSFTIAIPDAAIADLRRRLADSRWPAALDDVVWEDGTSLAFLRRLVDHWLHRFDWRAQEARLNRLPQFMARVNGADIHFVHQRGTGPAPLPLILTHGWPGSFVEYERIIPLLADPGAYGGDPADAFHVVVPSLPGYGFSPAPKHAGVGSRAIASPWSSRAGVAGGALAGATFAVTVSIMLAVPIWETASGGFPWLNTTGSFLIKDVALLGISLVVLGEALARLHGGEARAPR